MKLNIPYKLLGLVSLPATLASIILLTVLNVGGVYEPPWLSLFTNLIFISLVSIFISYLSAKAFLNGGSFRLLFLGGGMLTLGLSVIGAGWLVNLSNGTNLSVTVHNIGILLAAVLHLGSGNFLSQTVDQKAISTTKRLITGAGVDNSGASLHFA